MASEFENSVLVRALECPICYMRYDQVNAPRALRCRHSFCENCIGQLIRNRDGSLCPECMSPIHIPRGGITQLPVDMSLLRIVEDARTHNRTQSQRQVDSVHGRTPTTPTMADYQNESEPLLPSNYEDENHVIGNRNCYRCCCASCCCNIGSCLATTGTKLYRSIERVLDTILEQNRLMWIVVFTLFGVSAVCKFIGGAVKLTSDCPLEKLVAIYLFAKGCLAFFFWVPWMLILVNGQAHRAWQNTFVVAYTIFDALATCGLQIFVDVITLTVDMYLKPVITSSVMLETFIVNYTTSAHIISEFMGTVVAIGYYGYVKQCDDHFANLALGLTAFDWFGVAVFLYCSCYIACGNQHNTDYYDE